jgi:hypothetical protein
MVALPGKFVSGGAMLMSAFVVQHRPSWSGACGMAVIDLLKIVFHLRVLLQNLKQSFGDQIIASGVSVPWIGLHVDFSKGLDGPVKFCFAVFSFDRETPNMWHI